MADDEALPTFRYHRAPLATGSVVPSELACCCCERARGFIYVGPVHSEDELDDSLCPWCIASGEANERLGATFVDPRTDSIGTWSDVSDAVAHEVATRTPAFSGWQEERWWAHCGDAAEFIGRAGAAEVERHGAQTKEHLRLDRGFEPGPEFETYLQSLELHRPPTAFLFRCLRCGEVGGYSDFT